MSTTGTDTTFGAKLNAILTDPRDATRGPAPLGTRVKWAFVIRRIEFLPVHLLIGLVPVIFAAHSWNELLTVNALVAVIFSIMHMELADMINALSDRELDALFKSKQSEAIYGLGVSKVVGHIIVSTILYFAAAVFLAARTGHWDIVLITAAAWLAGVQYSLPPLHLKGSGIWQLPTLQVGCVVLPGLVALRIYDHGIEWAPLVIVLGFAMIWTGMFVTNHAEDYVEDGQFGIETYVRALGIHKAVVLQSTLVGIGAVAVACAAYFGYGFSWALIPFVLVWLIAQRFLLGVARDVRGPLDEAIAVLHKKSVTGPYNGVALAFMTVLLGISILIGW